MVAEFFVNYSFQVIGAFIVLILGWLVARWVGGLLLRAMDRRRMDVTLSKFLVSIVKIVVLAFALIIALGKFGITISPFIAAMGAVAFGTTLALQGTLANYGAGLTIILTRPFVVGNTIRVAGVSGVVEEVKLACTILTDEDGVRITVPNRQIVGQILHNSAANTIVEGSVGISYDSAMEKAIGVVRGVLARFEDVVKAPAPQVGIQEFGDFAVKLGFRYWVPTHRYFQVSYTVNLAMYEALRQAGIKIPFPQQEISIVSQAGTPPGSRGEI
jgi:small conductance mechanosensitive channel